MTDPSTCHRHLPPRPVALLLGLLLLALAGEVVPGRLGLDALDGAALASADRSVTTLGTYFLAARTVNAVLSVARSVTVGAGVSVSPGQALDPLDRAVDAANDLLVAGLTLCLTTKLVLAAMGGVGPLALVLGTVVLWLARRVPGDGGLRLRRLAGFVLLAVLVARLGLPLTVWAADQCAGIIVGGRGEAALAELGRFGMAGTVLSASPSDAVAAFEGVKVAALALASDPGGFVTALGTVAGIALLRALVLPLVIAAAGWRVLRLVTV